MRADCLIRVRWQQRMLSSEVKENTSPTESEVSGPVDAVHWAELRPVVCRTNSSNHRHE
jgi:hypothetical protein